MITINVGAMLLPIPLEDAIAQSIKALNAYENPIILILCIPAAITAGSVANRDKNGRPKKKSAPPRSRPALKE